MTKPDKAPTLAAAIGCGCTNISGETRASASSPPTIP